MNRLYLKINFIFLLILLLSLNSIFLFSQPQRRVVAALSTIKGNVKVRAAQERQFKSAYKGQMIRDGEWIKTEKDVFASILFLDGTTVKIQSKTELEIKKDPFSR